MKNRIFVLLLVLTAVSAANAQLVINDVVLSPGFKSGNKELSLNGGGIRKKFFLDIYVTGLYLNNNSTDGQKIIKADEAMSIQLHIVSDMITSALMISSLEEGFEKSTGGTQENFRTEIDMLTRTFSDQIVKGDYYDISYAPGSSVEVYKNGTLTASFGDLKFKQALWGIWLGDNPVDKKLKNQMLGLSKK